MKKDTTRISLYGLGALSVAISAQAAVIVWPDDQASNPLRTDPVWKIEDSLFPNGNAGNEVIVQSGIIPGDVLGGINWSGGAYDNTVTINGGVIGSAVLGGAGVGGSVMNNRVIFNDGSAGQLYGAWGFNSHVTNNSVTINGGEVAWVTAPGCRTMTPVVTAFTW